jgi:DNA-binding NarL/FixJ family response regulator
MAKMVLIEAHPLLRLGLHQILSNIEGVWDIKGVGMDEFDNVDESLVGVDLLVFGLPIDTTAGWQALQRVQSSLQPKRVLLLTDAMPWKMPSEGLPEGTILGCLMKTASIEVLEAAIKLVMAGGQCFPNSHMVQMSNLSALADHDENVQTADIKPAMPVTAGAQLLKITPRQYEVLVLLARGYPIKTVSRLLNISVATAKTHACTLYQRLHVKNKGEAVYAALQRGAKLDWNPAMQPPADQTYGFVRKQA